MLRQTSNLGLMLISILMIGAPAMAKDAALLNQAVTDSFEERAGVEAEYKTNYAAPAAESTGAEAHSIDLVLGDELGAGSSRSSKDHLKVRSQPHGYEEKRVAAKLDKEWKEVNKSVKRASHEIKDQPSKKAEKEDAEF